ncbi:S-layer homology domain-containing protein [Halobacillus trueperi]|uniref:S-layer homology domain-containing protein n=1 Tax=Halobacillus trueperi TaxID=156205 RepID=UPI003735165C
MSYQPKSNRKFYATALTTAVVASAVAPVAVSADHVFSDVEDGQYYSEAVHHLADQGVLQGPGDGTFNPDGKIIRASAAEVLMKAQGLTPGGTENFSDVDEDDWFYNAVRATSPAIFEGDGSGEFNPSELLTREQAAAIIVRAYGLTGDTAHSFSDVEDGSWAEEAIAIAAENGIIKGYNGKFMPKDDVTRKDFAVMVYRAMQNEEDPQPEPGITVESTTVVDAHTLEVTWSNGETTTVELEEALVNGDNEVTFEVDGEEYTVTVSYDALTPAVEAAEEAIANLPEELTLEDAEAVEAARALVDAALEIDEDAEIEGLETLVAAEEVIEMLEAEAAAIAEATEAVETAEESLLEEDLADAQELVDELSDSDAKVLLNARLVNVQDQLDSIIEAVNDAEGELETFRALDVKPFENVNEDYIDEYVAAIIEATTGEDGSDFTTVAEIQELIDTENKEILDAELDSDVTSARQAVTKVEDEVQSDEYKADDYNVEETFYTLVDDAQEAINELPADYVADEDVEDTPEVDLLQERLDAATERVENYLNYVKPVVNAETQVELYNSLEANFENVNEGNIEQYDLRISKSLETVDEVQYLIDLINAEQAIANFGDVDEDTTQEELDALKSVVEMIPDTEEDEDGNPVAGDDEKSLLAVVKDLQTSFDNLQSLEAITEAVEALTTTNDDEEEILADGVTQDDIDAVVDLLEGYEGDAEDLEGLKAAVDTAQELLNAEVLEAAKSAVETLTTTDDEDNVILAEGVTQENIDAATDLLETYQGADENIAELTATVETAQDLLDTMNIYNAKTAEELEDLLVDLGNERFNNLASVNRLEVAELLLEDLEDAEFSTTSEISEAVYYADDETGVESGIIVEYEDSINEVNIASTITDTDEALEALEIEEYEALSAAEQLEVAENVLNNKPLDKDGNGTYTSISSIVANF